MGLIKDIDELNTTEKSFVVGIPVLMVFWYISLYLFHKSFFHTNDFILVSSFCFGLAICWYIINIVLNFLVIPIIEDDFDADAGFVSTAVSSVLYMALIILLNYFLKFEFLYFLLGAFTWILVRILFGLILIFIKHIVSKTNQEKQ